MKKRTLKYKICLICCLVILLISTVTFFCIKFNTDIIVVKEIRYTVKYSDTLWDIAKAHNINNEDVRKLVYEIKRFNNFDDSIIYPGQSIIIPIQLSIDRNMEGDEIAINN